MYLTILKITTYEICYNTVRINFIFTKYTIHLKIWPQNINDLSTTLSSKKLSKRGDNPNCRKMTNLHFFITFGRQNLQKPNFEKITKNWKLKNIPHPVL